MGGPIAIITARGGSKRIPHKNVKSFCGKPIIAYSIEAALKSGLFSDVMVSTDDEAIADIACRYGASVPFLRSESTSNDYATTADVILEVVDEYAKRGVELDIGCCLYPTAPFVTPDKLRSAYDLLEPRVDSVFTVTEFSFPPQRGLIQSSDGAVSYWQPENADKRSQDLTPIFHDAGQFYFFRVASLRRNHSLVGERSVGFVVDQTEVQDIDNPSDWDIAEMKYERMSRRGK